MLNEMIGVFTFCPLCGRYHRAPLEYWWCPYCRSNLQSQINNLEKRIEKLEHYLQEEDREELID